MDALFENNINHNASLGALALWSFTAAYFKQRRKTAGPSLHELMLALPIAFHPISVAALYNRNRDGALPKALADEPMLVVGLQRRVEGYADRTLRALNLALAAELIALRREDARLMFIPGVSTAPFRYDAEELRQMLAAADRVGHWVALSGFHTACSILGLRF